MDVMLLQTQQDQNIAFILFVSPLMTFFFYIAKIAKTERKGQFLILSFSRLHDLKFHALLPSGHSSQAVLPKYTAACLYCTC